VDSCARIIHIPHYLLTPMKSKAAP
jgi:hypothetical protein